jgi:hypothetical protein
VIPPNKTETTFKFLTKIRDSPRHDNGSKPARKSANSNITSGAPSFSPYLAVSPHRIAASPCCCYRSKICSNPSRKLGYRGVHPKE